MRRHSLSQRIAEAEKHIRHGDAIIARQRSAIAGLHGRGADPTLALQILDLFERSQALHVEHRDRLRDALSPPPWRERAAQARRVAETFITEDARKAMLFCAAAYDGLARSVER